MERHLKKYLPLISSYVDDELQTEVRRFLEDHLRGCGACQGALEDFRKLKAVASALPPYSASPYFLTRLKANLETQPETNGEVAAIEARLLVPIIGLLVLALALLFSFTGKETSEGYLFYSTAQQTVVEEQLLQRQVPFSKDEVLVLVVSDHRREE